MSDPQTTEAFLAGWKLALVCAAAVLEGAALEENAKPWRQVDRRKIREIDAWIATIHSLTPPTPSVSSEAPNA
jgi:hypothetical protein